MINFLIVTCGYKCEDTIQKCIKSVNLQSYEEWMHCVVVDEVKINNIVFDDIYNRTTSCIDSRRGKMHNFYELLSKVTGRCSEVIVIDLDADDYLEPNALEVLAEIYKDPNIWCTHGSYKMLSGRKARFNGEYKDNKFRLAPWRATHLKSFRAPLFYKIKPRDFKGRDGKWLMSCSDMAIMFPVMELSGLDRIRFVPEVIYNYNDLSDLNDHKVAGEEQKRNERMIRKRPRYKRLESL